MRQPTKGIKIKWALRIAETKKLLSMNQTGIEVTEELMAIQSKIDNIDDCDIMGLMDIMQGMADIVKKIFDWDGTLVDSVQRIVDSMWFAATECGLRSATEGAWHHRVERRKPFKCFTPMCKMRRR